MATTPRRKGANGSLIRRLHRWLGLGAIVFVLVLAATGWLLNHTDDLNLATRHVALTPVLQWYGIAVPRVDTGYRLAGSDWLIQAAGRLYLNENRIARENDRLIGAVAVKLAGLIAAAFPESVYLFTPQGELVEKLGRSDGLPAALQRVGVAASGAVVVQSARGAFAADPQVNRWSEFSANSVRWAQSDTPPDALRDPIARDARRSILSWERVLLDLHSGRLFGRAGVLLFDAVAFLLVVLAVTGLYIWLKIPVRRR